MGGSMTKILPGLYVGGFDNAKNEEELMANCISHIIIVQNSKNDIERSISRQYLHLIVNEKLENSLLNQIQLSNDFIHRARLDSGNVLVCSDSGLSANVAVVTAYLMTVYSLDYYSAIGALRSLRYGAHPVEPLQKQLIEFDSETNEKLVNKQNHTNNTHREQQQQQQTELLDSSKHPSNSIMYLTITSASERERLNSIYGEWPYLEEDLQILHTALNSHLNSTEESEFLFNNEYDKTIQNDKEYDVDIDNNENNPSNTRTTVVVATVKDNHINPSIHGISETSSILNVIEHTKDHGSLTDSESIQSNSKYLDKRQDNTILSNNDNNNNNNTDDDEDGCGSVGVCGNDLDSIPFVTVPINGVLISDNVIEKSSSKPSSNESDVFIVDSTQLPESWDRLSNANSSIQSENSLEIGFELKDDLDDNIPGAIEIPAVDSMHIRSYGTAHTYNNQYGRSNPCHSIYKTAHSLYPTTTININNKFTYQQICPNTTLWNPYNYDRSELMHTTQLKNYNNLSTTAPNCDIYFRT
ncbi:unnamed protein product [Schistosoma intercalatum]|nr:unnamed protein product [Schistosoma intercalatum]